MENDQYQARYLRHQQFGKKQELIALMKERHSNRRFGDAPVTRDQIDELIESTKDCPSSCDRHGVRIRVITERNEKDLLDGLLVGGTGWVYRAPVVFLLLADRQAYKADGGREIDYNSYIDAGVMVQQMSLVATAMGLHCAFINPNIRDENKQFFYERFTPEGWEEWPVFCGAFVFGPPHPDAIEKQRNYEYDPEVAPSPQRRIAKAEEQIAKKGLEMLRAAPGGVGTYGAGLPEETKAIMLPPGGGMMHFDTNGRKLADLEPARHIDRGIGFTHHGKPEECCLDTSKTATEVAMEIQAKNRRGRGHYVPEEELMIIELEKHKCSDLCIKERRVHWMAH